MTPTVSREHDKITRESKAQVVNCLPGVLSLCDTFSSNQKTYLSWAVQQRALQIPDVHRQSTRRLSICCLSPENRKLRLKDRKVGKCCSCQPFSRMKSVWIWRNRPECYCLSRHVLAVPSFSMRGIIIAQIQLSDFRLLSSMNRRLSIKRSDA